MRPKDPIAVWNNVVSEYDGSTPQEKSYEGEENRVIAWPHTTLFIKQYVSAGSRILELGCGTGEYALELARSGYEVIGIDPAKQMIEAAQKHTENRVQFLTGNSQTAATQGEFAAVVGMMVFQFISDLDAALSDVNRSLSQKSCIVLAVFNPEWIRRCVAEEYDYNNRYTGFQNASCLGSGFMDFHERGKAPVFVRTADEYDIAMTTLGFRKQLECTPPFPADFVKEYRRPGPVDVSEFLILGYTRE